MTHRRKTYMTPLEQYAATFEHYWKVGQLQEARLYGEREIALAESRMQRSPRLCDFPFFAIIQRPHRLFVPGDLVLYTYDNGCADRYRVWSVSSKGFKVSGYYMLFFHWDGRVCRSSGLLKQIWRPGDLAPSEDGTCCQKLDHPATQSYLEDLAVRETPTRR